MEVVSEVRVKTYGKLYQSLGTKAGEWEIYRLAKGRENKDKGLEPSEIL